MGFSRLFPFHAAFDEQLTVLEERDIFGKKSLHSSFKIRQTDIVKQIEGELKEGEQFSSTTKTVLYISAICKTWK